MLSITELIPRAIDTCSTSNDYDGNNNLRILSVFILLISASIGVFFPILASRYSFINLPGWCFFIAKFFGSGVIVATAFIHLLEPASEELGDDCLGGTFAEYPWAFGICLMSLFFLFLVEIISHYFVNKNFGHDHGHDETGTIVHHIPREEDEEEEDSLDEDFKKGDIESQTSPDIRTHKLDRLASILGKDHFSHDSTHQDPSQLGTSTEEFQKEQYLNQIVALFILESGIIFHSIFIGLSLAVTGAEFKTLFIVLTFHQMFEGLGLGTRISEANWPQSKKYIPWLMGLAFALTTAIAVAIGIGVRHSWVPGSRNALIASGIFDSISAGILIYTGLVELMAHEFLYSNQFKGPDGFKRMLFAYFIMCCGAALMALLGKWA
ncbi:hypothetical protein KAFR_0H02250 [Kazachstania africana CBS 2517]|uniref:Uncharacterized protein n=1 Tax=Kazachstania africana (strain ATCC 22294 / BCRC 22015 / CBS 2517 / CECT 1963 / NBRC 1671 / NRRL Y-8276) TaxID=1071382 RepID=H2AZ78_KAZAF|nr:hypothetical protein KAFR_0H02250 [Kazachstania africana CBS 2517]CCF59634.1 hypothetical protein KAFR_0H02250 [Kazachstania africana CBS 2517]